MEFQKARAIWAKDRAAEKNCELTFLSRIPKSKNTFISIATSGIYRLWVNDKFKAAGPARTAHGYFRVDEYLLDESLTEAENVVKVEVLGYNVNSYDTLNQRSFLTAEIKNEDGVVSYTGGDNFCIYDRKERVQKVQRYSFQRAFIEDYRLSEKKTWDFLEEEQEFRPEPYYIEREIRYPRFEVLKAEAVIAEGRATFDNEVRQIIGEENYFKVSDQFLGFAYEDVEEHISEEAQRIRCYLQNREEEAGSKKYLKNGYVLYRFPYNATGFYRINIKAEEDSRIFVQFDELLTGDDIDFLRMQSCNCFVYTVHPGHYQLMSFAPYVMKYLKIIVKGACLVENVEIVEYKHPQVTNRICLPENDRELQTICKAALESYKANSLDVFMDCPSRERGGWLCDSYFTSAVERILTGESILEHAFLENFILEDKFAYLPEGMLPMCYPADHNNGNYIPNWGMWFVIELERYVRNTGDRNFAMRAKKAVDGLVDFFASYENEYGLLEDLDGWVFVEWSRANSEELVKGVNFPTNMLYAKMLSSIGTLYEISGFTEKARKLKETIRNRSLRGNYFTDHEHRIPQGWKNTGECTEVCQYYAFFSGIAARTEDRELWETLVREFGPERRINNLHPQIAFTNAFIGNYLRIEFLYEAGLYDEVITNIRKYFLPMAEKTGTLWEHDSSTGSCNHGFASYVIYWLAGIYGIFSENGPEMEVTYSLC